MQPTEPSNFQRRPMDIEDYLNILRRNLSWVIGPLLASVTIAVVVAFFWPDTYVSQASIRVVPPQVPTSVVANNLNIGMSERISNMKLSILSRSTLTNIINTYDLYRKDRASLLMEDLIEKLKRNIDIKEIASSGNRGATALRISFSYENRYIAQKVTLDLQNRFIVDDQREGASRSRMTTDFLKEQYTLAQSQLDAFERKLIDFRVSHMGTLPDQMQNNVQRIQSLESRNSLLNANISRINQEKLLLDSDLRNLRERLATAQQAARVIADNGGRPSGAPDADDIAVAEKEKEIQAYQRTLDKYLLQYTETYPEVQKLRRMLESAKKDKEALLNRKLAIKTPVAAAPASATAAPKPVERTKEMADIEASLSRLQAQYKAKELEAEGYIREISNNEKLQKDLQGRLEVGPQGAQELDNLMRDREIAQQQAESLKQRLAQSQMSTDLQTREQGERLEPLDLPSLPDSPAQPQRGAIIGAGAFLGLGLGGLLVVLRELRDHSLKTLKDVRAYTQFNVIGSIPLLENDMVVRRRRRIAVLGWSTATLLSALVASGSVYYYLSTRL